MISQKEMEKNIENLELICKRLGLKSGEILKNKSKIVVDEDLAMKKGIKR